MPLMSRPVSLTFSLYCSPFRPPIYHSFRSRKSSAAITPSVAKPRDMAVRFTSRASAKIPFARFSADWSCRELISVRAYLIDLPKVQLSPSR
jgi:hypothetical protein